MVVKELLLLVTVVLCREIENNCEVVEWTGGYFEWPNSVIMSAFKSCGLYIPKNLLATRGQMFQDEIYLAFPRYKPGIPVTLAKVGVDQTGCDAILEAYPSWSAQSEGDPNALQSVVDLYMDENNLLWVLDTGVTNILTQPTRRTPPKVVAIDVINGNIVNSLCLSGITCEASRLQYIVVEYTPDGRPFAYVSDAAMRSILVIDVTANSAYRVVLPSYVCTSKRDVLYIALIHKPDCNYLLITYLSGNKVFQIRTDYLRRGCATGKLEDLGTKNGRLIILGSDLGSAVFFRYEGKPEIYRWEVSSPIGDSELMYKSPDCYFATQTIADVSRHRIRVLESNFYDYLQGTVGCGASHRVALMMSCLDK